VMTPDELTGAARKLADGLGIPVYIRDGRIYQHGPGIEFLPSKGAGPTAVGGPFTKTDEAEC
jgi:hypothetical protein